MAKIIVIEDDIQYRNFLIESLVENGHVILAQGDNPVDILMHYKEYVDCDLLITDHAMPIMNGIDFVEHFKKVSPYTKTLLVSGLEEEEVELQALDVNINYFLNKKMSVEKFIKYVNRVLQDPTLINSNVNVPKLLSQSENIIVDTIKHTILKDGEQIKLTNTEFNLLVHFLRNRGIVLSRTEILTALWDQTPEEVSERIIDTHVKFIRKKLQIHCLQSIRGIGYKWNE